MATDVNHYLETVKEFYLHDNDDMKENFFFVVTRIKIESAIKVPSFK